MADLSEIIWRGCDPIISDAVKQVVARWRGYSTDLNAQRSVILLIEKFIDPAVAEYMNKIPKHYHFSILGGSGWQYSKFIENLGYDRSRQFHRMFEKNFSDLADWREDLYRLHIATLSSIHDIILACELRKPRRFLLRHKDGHDRNRDRIHCVICGNPTDFALSTAQDSQNEGKTITYSYKYCNNHKSLNNEKHNSSHKRSLRSLRRIDNEFHRLLARSNAIYNDKHECEKDLIKLYFYHYIRKHGLKYADINIIRGHASAMVESQISDKKKIMLALQKAGCNQSETARLLGIKNRQSVSKALASVPERFKLAIGPAQ